MLHYLLHILFILLNKNNLTLWPTTKKSSFNWKLTRSGIATYLHNHHLIYFLGHSDKEEIVNSLSLERLIKWPKIFLASTCRVQIQNQALLTLKYMFFLSGYGFSREKIFKVQKHVSICQIKKFSSGKRYGWVSTYLFSQWEFQQRKKMSTEF
jgi:hypothetical protein